MIPLLGTAMVSMLLGKRADTVSNFITSLGKKRTLKGGEEVPYSLVAQLDPDFSLVNAGTLLGGGAGEAFPTDAPMTRPNAEFLAMASKLVYEDFRVGWEARSRGGALALWVPAIAASAAGLLPMPGRPGAARRSALRYRLVRGLPSLPRRGPLRAAPHARPPSSPPPLRAAPTSGAIRSPALPCPRRGLSRAAPHARPLGPHRAATPPGHPRHRPVRMGRQGPLRRAVRGGV